MSNIHFLLFEEPWHYKKDPEKLLSLHYVKAYAPPGGFERWLCDTHFTSEQLAPQVRDSPALISHNSSVECVCVSGFSWWRGKIRWALNSHRGLKSSAFANIFLFSGVSVIYRWQSFTDFSSSSSISFPQLHTSKID